MKLDRKFETGFSHTYDFEDTMKEFRDKQICCCIYHSLKRIEDKMSENKTEEKNEEKKEVKKDQ